MANLGTTTVPRTAVVPLAMAAARRAKVVAIATGVLCATCLLLGLADVIENSSRPDRNDVAAMFWTGVFGLVCALGVRRAKRAMAAARRAAADVGSTWTLVDKLIVVVDDRGQPVPEHSFKITRAQQAPLVSDQTTTLESHRKTG